MKVGLSLLGVVDPEPSVLASARNHHVSSFSLAPDHFFEDGRPLGGRALVERCETWRSYGLEIDSLQGLLFGVNIRNSKDVDDRLRWLRTIANNLGNPPLVLGSREARQTDGLWAEILRSFYEFDFGDGHFFVENLCAGDCIDDIFHSWGGLQLVGDNLAYDFANALECSYLKPIQLFRQRQFGLVHLSGPGHKEEVPKSYLAELSEIFLQTVEFGGQIVFEFTSRDLSERMQAAAALVDAAISVSFNSPAAHHHQIERS